MLETVRGDPATRRRLETRFVIQQEGGAYGLTYRWTDPPTNAVLVAEEGWIEEIAIRDGDEEIRQVWEYPSRADCLRCHTPAAGWALGFGTRQLQLDLYTEIGMTNQIARLAAAGYLEEAPASYAGLPALARIDDEEAGVEWRARSWLDANCSQCHRPGGPAIGNWDARAVNPLFDTGIIRGFLHNFEEDASARVVLPGSTEHSMMLRRVGLLGERRMPPLASRVVDEAAVALLSRWIAEDLPSRQSYAEWKVTHFGSTQVPEAADDADGDGDGAVNRLEFLTYTDPKDAGEAWRMAVVRSAGGVRLQYPHLPHRAFLVEWTRDPSDPSSWLPVESPANRHRIVDAPFLADFEPPFPEGSVFYRVRVEER
ncbi:MAG: hypothetical protein KF833_11395 [Verrucomicrobiae bacterium]|nr:hypothetical protein [Verrucomicrobiae bacterium]